LLTAAILVTCPVFAPAAETKDTFFLKNGQRVVFLGDSNTYAGGFIAILDAYLFTRFPDWKVELINLGLPSETVSGLSEPDHPYPRPCVHERLARALAKTKPDVVVVCYGMNDGIYYPDSDEHFAKYREGMQKLIDRCQKAGTKVVLMTPAPFDPVPLQGKTLPRAAKSFSWVHPFEGYDDALTRYSKWLVGLRKEGVRVADPHSALNKALIEIRKIKKTYAFSGDGIHPNTAGHWLIAEQLLRALSAPRDVDSAVIDAKTMKVASGTVSKLRWEGDALHFTWTAHLPLPVSPQWSASLPNVEKSAGRWNSFRLVVSAAAQDQYAIFADKQPKGAVSRETLAMGLHLDGLLDKAMLGHVAEIGKLVEQRQRVLGPAWLDEVGHKRPDTPKGLLLTEARQRAAELEVKIRKLARPTNISLHLIPVKRVQRR
jgi:lysophospholipase L1-like esterase